MRLFFRWQQLLLLTLTQVSSSSNVSFNVLAQASINRHISFNKPGGQNLVSLLRIESPLIEGNDVPTLTPIQEIDANKPRKQRLAAVIGGVGAGLLVILFVGLIYICLMRVRRRFLRHTTSETVSSPLSPPEPLPPYVSHGSSYSTQNLRQISLPELDRATNYFNQNNVIGEGLFGLVYKGLLQDGSIVAAKRRIHTQNQSFVDEVHRLAQVQHKNLVKIIGYYEDCYQQILVSDYIHNGDVGRHLYDSEGIPIGKLNIQQRLLIALGAAKGLEHLHGLDPPLAHMHFKTRNVLLDENLTAKVSDYGISRLVAEDPHGAGPSSTSIDNFIDPLSSEPSDQNDVYSFGVFLLELVIGREANNRNQSNPVQSFVSQAKTCERYRDIMDKTLVGDEATVAAEEMMELALQCTDEVPRRRPQMRNVVMKLQEIQKMRFGNLYDGCEEEEIGHVTLGSELFR